MLSLYLSYNFNIRLEHFRIVTYLDVVGYVEIWPVVLYIILMMIFY